MALTTSVPHSTSSHMTPNTAINYGSTTTSTSGGLSDGVELLHVDWVQELPEDLDVCIAQRDFEAAVDLIQKSIFASHDCSPLRDLGL